MRHSKEFYRNYLRSGRWQEKRLAALDRAGNKCEWRPCEEHLCVENKILCEWRPCEETSRLQVHHLHYENLGREALEDLQVLCDLHHRCAELRKRALCLSCGGFVFFDLHQIPNYIQFYDSMDDSYLTVDDLIELAGDSFSGPFAAHMLCDGCRYVVNKEWKR